MIALLVFIMATLEIFRPQKKQKKNCRTQKGPFGGKGLKNPVQSDPRLMPLKKANEWPRLVKPFN